jgi:hypothetical protein
MHGEVLDSLGERINKFMNNAVFTGIHKTVPLQFWNLCKRSGSFFFLEMSFA